MQSVTFPREHPPPDRPQLTCQTMTWLDSACADACRDRASRLLHDAGAREQLLRLRLAWAGTAMAIMGSTTTGLGARTGGGNVAAAGMAQPSSQSSRVTIHVLGRTLTMDGAMVHMSASSGHRIKRGLV